ncbi:DUF4864 domain-containing protein [Marivivens marinus]|uniref:DUF4864 domain-containing protein n=1 Tax=Marivivens marinus TaxID=3110173 RepID=UPI003B84B2C9
MLRLTALLALLATPVVAQDRAAIEAVIDDQMDAFTGRDLDGAWTHASPMIQRLFQTPENFGLMVREGYPMVWDNEAIRFMDLTEADGAWRQDVLVEDSNGTLHMLEYLMIETPQGWKINGVGLLPAPDLGV